MAVAAFAVTASAQDSLSPQELAAFVSAVAPHQTVNISSPVAGSYTLNGPKGVGRIAPSAGGWVIYYGGKAHNVTRSGSGWSVYGGSKTVSVSAPVADSRSINGLKGGGGSVVPSGGGSTVYYGGKGHDVMRNGSGWTIYAPSGPAR